MHWLDDAPEMEKLMSHPSQGGAWKFAFIGGTLVAAFLGGSASRRACAAEATSESDRARQVLRVLANRQRQLESLKIEYRFASYGPDFPQGTFLHRVVAARRPASLWHLSAHGHSDLAWQDDPFQQLTYVTKTQWFRLDPINRAYYRGTISASDPLPGSLGDDFLFFATGLWILDRAAPRRGEYPHVIRDIAESNLRYRMREESEMVLGRLCDVVELPEQDIIWIDSASSSEVVAREVAHPTRNRVWERLELTGYRDVGKGFTLPENVEWTRFSSSPGDDQNRKRQVESQSRIQIVRVDVDSLAERDFEYDPLPGSLQLSVFSNQTPIQVRPGGCDFLEDLVAWCHRTHPMRKSKPPPISKITLLCATVVLILIAEWLYRRSARRRSPWA